MKNNNENEKSTMKQLIVSIVAWILIVALILYKHKKLYIIRNDIINPSFSISLLAVIIFSVYCWHSDNQKLKLSTEKACFALIIAYLSRLDMIFAVYFIIFIFAYYAHDDIV
jgi:hypothetical protein